MNSFFYLASTDDRMKPDGLKITGESHEPWRVEDHRVIA